MQIAGIGYRLGERVVTNDEILDRVVAHSPDYDGDIDEALARISAALSKSGAQTRRWLSDEQRPIEMACEAVDDALTEAGLTLSLIHI